MVYNAYRANGEYVFSVAAETVIDAQRIAFHRYYGDVNFRLTPDSSISVQVAAIPYSPVDTEKNAKYTR